MGAFAEGALIHQFTSTATAGGTTALTVTSTTWQRFTGTTTETVTLPDATTMRRGREFVIDNRSTGALTVNFSGSSLAAEIAPGTSRTYRLFGNGAAAGDWAISNQVDVDGPLALFATRSANDSLLNIGANQVTGSDGTTKSTPPLDDTIQSYVASTIDFQTATAVGGTTGGAFTTEAGTFTRPAIALGQFTRMVMVYQSGNNAIDTKFSPSAASQGALEDAGTLFSSLDGTPVGFVDLESTGASNFNFKTPGAATDIIENLGLTTFASGAGGGAGGDESFKLQSISSNVGTIKKGYILLSDGRELATYDGAFTNVALAFDLKSAVNTAGVTAPSATTTYYLYLDLNAIPGSSLTDGDSDRVVYGAQSGTSGMFTVLATTPEFTNLSRYIPLASLKTDGSSDYVSFADLNGRKHTLPTSLSAANIEASVRDQLLGSTYELASPVIFSVDAETCVDTGTSTGEYTGSYDLDATEILATVNLLDGEVLDAPVKIQELDLSVYWGTKPTLATTYEVSRNGGAEYQTITMTEVGSTGAYYGTHAFTAEAAEVSILTQAAKDTDTALNGTTQQSIGQLFTTVDPVVMTSVDLDIIKTGLPVGNVYASIYTDDTGAPGTLIGESQALAISGLSTGTENFTFPDVVLDDTVYHFVIRTDAEYKGVFSTGVTEIKIENASSATSGLAVNDGSVWTPVATSALKYELKGQPLDVRVKITANAGEPATVKVDALSIFYVPEAQGSVNGTAFCQTFSFNSTDNTDSFVLTWLPDPKLLSVYYKETGQVFREGAYSISGQTIIFPVDSFNNGGVPATVTLEFIQLEGSSFDNSDSNAASITTINNNLDALAVKTACTDQVDVADISVPFTTITGRKPIKNLAAIPSTHLGIERVHLKNKIFLLDDEVGPTGQVVYGTHDPLDRVRYYGLWTLGDSDQGKFIASQLSGNSFVELTFYGTGLNILAGIQGLATDLEIYVDGSLDSSPSLLASNVLINRKYDQNQVHNLISGLTLGTHTIRVSLKTGSVIGLTVYGFEFLNESTTLDIPTGDIIVGEDRLTIAATSAAYASDFDTASDAVGTKGGCAVVYGERQADGTFDVKKRFNATDGSQLNLGAASHANETLQRKINFREFGAGRADDFSTLAGSPSDRAFTLDDGTTTLVGNDASSTVGIGDLKDGFGLDAGVGFLTITFVGTGLDIELDTFGGTLASGVDIYVDGSSIFSGLSGTAFGTVSGTKPIVSGLPFGTHTVNIEATSAGTGPYYKSFLIYAPTKPAIPAGAAELGSYYLMADFVVQSSDAEESISSGVLRKHSTREFVYQNDWTATLALNRIGGWYLRSFASGVNDNGSLTFYGTGVVVITRLDDNTNAWNLTLIDSAGVEITDFSSYSFTKNDANLTLTSNPANISCTAGTGTNASVRLSGLPLGLYTLKMNHVSGAQAEINAFDIVTPVFSYDADRLLLHDRLIGSNSVRSEVGLANFVKEKKFFVDGVDLGASKTKWQRKTELLNHTAPGVIEPLSFHGLTIGKTYRASGWILAHVIPSTGTAVHIEFEYASGGNISRIFYLVNNSGAAESKSCGWSVVFTATETTVQVNVITFTPSGEISAGPNLLWSLLEELPNHIETSEW